MDWWTDTELPAVTVRTEQSNPTTSSNTLSTHSYRDRNFQSPFAPLIDHRTEQAKQRNQRRGAQKRHLGVDGVERHYRRAGGRRGYGPRHGGRHSRRPHRRGWMTRRRSVRRRNVRRRRCWSGRCAAQGRGHRAARPVGCEAAHGGSSDAARAMQGWRPTMAAWCWRGQVWIFYLAPASVFPICSSGFCVICKKESRRSRLDFAWPKRQGAVCRVHFLARLENIYFLERSTTDSFS